MDSGATTTFISREYANRCGLKQIPYNGIILRGGKQEKGKEYVVAEVSNGQKIATLKMPILEHFKDDLLIGLKHFPVFGYRVTGVPNKTPGPEVRNIDSTIPEIQVVKSDTQNSSLDDSRIIAALAKNTRVDPLATCTHPLAILDMEFKSDPTCWINRNYIKANHEQRTSEIIKEWLEANVIEETTEPGKTNFALLAVPKKDHDGNETDIRICVDLKPLNDYLLDDNYPIPKIERVLQAGCKSKGPDSRRSAIDLTAAYHRFSLSWKGVAFKWQGKRYRFIKAMFGVKTMTAKFQRVIDSILAELNLPGVDAYIDDITISADTREEEIIKTVKVIEKLTDYRMIINEKKSQFGVYTLDLLGYQIDGEGMKPHPSKVESIMKWPRPTTGKQVKSFMGVVNFNRNSMKHFALIAAPLDRMRECKNIVWNDELEKSFNDIKTALKRATQLVVEDNSKEVLLGTDASELGFGFWRGQVKDEFKLIPSEELKMDQIEVIQYGSVATRSNSLKYASATSRELGAAIWSIKKVLSHLWGKRFTLFTDHSALTSLFCAPEKSNMMHRWIDLLMALDYQVVHWKGLDNTVADGLSREATINQMEELKNEEAIIRGKMQPENQELRDKMIIECHSLGHYGGQQVFLQI